MVRNRVFEGKDLVQALQAASSALGVDEPELDYEILEQGRRGLFGVGAKNVRIRVMPPVEMLSDDHIQRDIEPQAEPPRESATREPAAEPSEAAGKVGQTLQRMVDLLGLKVRIEPAATGSGASFVLDGPDRKRLLRKDAEVLSALQFLLNRMARRAWPGVGRIRLTCNGPRQDDGDGGDVVELVREVAQQVDRTGKTKRLHPMNAYERRLVHLTIRDYRSLGSRSEGRGHLKRVSIYKT